MNPILAIVVTYNRLALLKECIASLLAQTETGFDILIVDNCSTDGTDAYAAALAEDPRILYDRLPQNVGGAGGFCHGVRAGRDKGYETLWIMDDDTIPAPDALATLLAAGQRVLGQYGFLASNVRWTDGSACLMNIPAVSDAWIDDASLLPAGLLRLVSASFVSLLVPVAVVREVGLPIKEFFIWGDDVEYTSRISARYPAYFCAQSVVTHKMQRNERTDLLAEDGTRLARYRILYRNQFYSAKKRGRRAALHYVKDSLKMVLTVLRRSPTCKWRKAQAILLGLWDGLRFAPRIER